MGRLFATGRFERVVNLAAQAGVRYSLKNPHAYVQSNLVGFANLLEGCRHHGVKHFVFASSSSVYGANTKIPFSTHDPVNHPVRRMGPRGQSTGVGASREAARRASMRPAKISTASASAAKHTSPTRPCGSREAARAISQPSSAERPASRRSSSSCRSPYADRASRVNGSR